MVKIMDFKKNCIPQVSEKHYKENYDGLNRFISYYYQIEIAYNLNVKNVLEIGVGNKTVSLILKNRGIKIVTCDFDPALQPDYVADIRNLPFEKSSFDLVMACQVLEHLPWSDASTAIFELSRVTQKYAIISLPYSSIYFEMIIKLPFLKNIFKKPHIDFCVRLPIFFKKFKPTIEHYWEIGWRGFSIIAIRKELKKYFRIIEEKRPILNTYHHFFVLEKSDN